MAVVSGKAGTLMLDGGAVTPLTNWKLHQESNVKSYAANDTGGALRRVCGPEDSWGRFECQATAAKRCPVERGESALAQFHVDASRENYYEVPVLIESVEVDCDIATGRPVAFAVQFHGDGPVVAHGILARRNA